MAITDRVIITFNNLAKVNGIDLTARSKESITSSEKSEILADIKKRLDAWVEGSNRPFQGVVTPPLEDKVVRHMTTVAHRTFKKFGGLHQSLKFDALIGMYVMQSEDEEETLTAVRDSMKQLFKQAKTPSGDAVFILGSGGAADVVRMYDEKGKSTGAVKPKEKAARGTAGKANEHKQYERYMAVFKAAGFSKDDFEIGKKGLKKDTVSIDELREYHEKLSDDN